MRILLTHLSPERAERTRVHAGALEEELVEVAGQTVGGGRAATAEAVEIAQAADRAVQEVT